MAQGDQGQRTRGFADGHLPSWPSPWHLPVSLRFCPCLRHVRPQQASAQAALIVEVACDPPLAPSARRTACGRGLDHGARLHAASHAAPGLQERDKFALGLGITLDVALRHGQTGMAGEFLHVPQTPPDLRDFAGRAGNKRPAAGMR
jgi:hypothetical protein